MIYELFYPLKFHYSWLSWLNVLRYIPFRTIMATITAMLLTFVLAPWFIRELRRKQIGQVVRSSGPETHKVKAGTPTMGGALILLSLLLPTVLWADLKNPFVLATTAVTAGYGVIGYLDDYLKIRWKSSGGLAGRYKLVGQVLIGGSAIAYIFLANSKLPADWLAIKTHLALPFAAFSKHSIDLPLWVYMPFALFVVVATSNAVNLTDGLDGLAIGPVMINAGHVPHLGVRRRRDHRQLLARDLPRHPQDRLRRGALACTAARSSARGSASSGTTPTRRRSSWGTWARWRSAAAWGCSPSAPRTSCSASCSAASSSSRRVSVITQVDVASSSPGKRIFLMAPIHHHYEKKGWAEPKIIVRFWIISILLALVSLASLKVR